MKIKKTTKLEKNEKQFFKTSWHTLSFVTAFLACME